MDEVIRFREEFAALTGNYPFPWQEALYQKFRAEENLSLCSISIPTGLGKTSIIAVWLLARATGAKLPRRLVYVVNRRTVVDQTTAEVERIRQNLPKLGLPGFGTLAISTLRGQFADNREWSDDPSRPAVIVGTVDMIGSRLLFSGYRVGFKSKPLHAGFLGQDALIVHDEAHLEPAFQKLIETVRREQFRCNDFAPIRVIELTATTRGSSDGEGEPDSKAQKRLFELTSEEKNPSQELPEPTEDEPPIYTIWRRLTAEKRLTFTPVEDDKAVPAAISKLAADYKDAQSGVLVFVRTLEAVDFVAKQLRKTGRSIVLLTGTIRGKERDELVGKPDFKRFLKDAEPGETVYLICTSAGEVGIDISADHMVCDLSTFESMVQRFGRVNRYALDSNGRPRTSRIDVVHPTSFGKIDKKTGELKADEIDKRRKRTLDLLRLLPEIVTIDSCDSIYDASPKAFADLRNLQELPCKIQGAFAPEPVIPPATDILFDAWALTSIREQMPGRPEVAPYLHGIADELPQTTIAWRAELDLLRDDPNPASALKRVFAKHRIRPHETLTVTSFHLIKFFKEIQKARPELLDTRVALIFSRGLELIPLNELLNDSRRLNADPTLILPASFGGLDENGMLAVPTTKTKTAQSETADEHARTESHEAQSETIPSLDVADVAGYEREAAAKSRMRLLISRSDDGWTASALPGAVPLPDDWNLEEPPEKSTRLVKQIQIKSGLKVRLVEPISWTDEGDPVCALICLTPSPKQKAPAEQPLEAHVSAVVKEATRLANELLRDNPVAGAALRFAAKWHDEGKKCDRWQRYIGRKNPSDPPLGKSAEWRDPKLLAGYRHEFGSMLRINDEAAAHFADPALKLTSEEQHEARELALHLIAAHHGYGRPHFVHAWDDDFTTPQCEQLHGEVIRRFTRLQHKYGRWGLAYLESLLRAADWAASIEAGIDPEFDDDVDPAEDET